MHMGLISLPQNPCSVYTVVYIYVAATSRDTQTRDTL